MLTPPNFNLGKTKAEPTAFQFSEKQRKSGIMASKMAKIPVRQRSLPVKHASISL
jgi:hypothetical protein